MNYEKSCGAVIFRREENRILFLVILNRKGNTIGHWGFPKGHMENKETEHTTATREIFEETGLRVAFVDGFRYVSNYSPRPNINKDAVYFLAESKAGKVIIQKSEVANYKWLTYERASTLLTHDRKVLDAAHEFLTKMEQ